MWIFASNLGYGLNRSDLRDAAKHHRSIVNFVSILVPNTFRLIRYTPSRDKDGKRFITIRGDGDIHFFLTGGKQIFDWGHWLSATGFRIPLGQQLWHAPEITLQTELRRST
jgi:hypothetical protein